MKLRRLATVCTVVLDLVASGALFAQSPMENAELRSAIGVLLDMMEAHTEMLIENMDDPKKAIEEMKIYCEENGKSVRAALETIEKFESTLSPEDKEAFEKEVEEKFGEILEGYKTAMATFTEKNPDEAMHLSEAVQKCLHKL